MSSNFHLDNLFASLSNETILTKIKIVSEKEYIH